IPTGYRYASSNLITDPCVWLASIFYILLPSRGWIFRWRLFFPTSGKPECIDFLETIKRPTRSVVIRHLAVSAQILASKGKVSNCLLHPSVRQNVHQRFADDVAKELDWCMEHINTEFITELQTHYDSLEPNKSEKLSFEVIYKTTK